MTTKLKKRNWIHFVIILGILTILFILNNSTNLFTKLNLYVQVEWFCWISLLITMFYTIYLAVEDRL